MGCTYTTQTTGVNQLVLCSDLYLGTKFAAVEEYNQRRMPKKQGCCREADVPGAVTGSRDQVKTEIRTATTSPVHHTDMTLIIRTKT
nr:hypothetical protein J6590_001737 [Homalodisca vitripennis]